MDIHAGIIAAALLLLVGAIFVARAGIRAIQSARNFSFYSLRRQRTASGWRLLLFSLFILLIAYWLPFYGEPLAYEYFPPSPTPSPIPTITLTPTITLSPTITLPPTFTNTPSVTDTPTATSTPFLPPAIEALFESVVTPNPNAVFSPISFSTSFDGVNAINPQTVFQNPVGHMYGAFSYNEMIPGVQWTALWLRDGELVHYETKPWDGTTGGYGYTDWNPDPSEWLPGTYTVQIFVGLDYKVIGQFVVQGEPPGAAPAVSPTSTP